MSRVRNGIYIGIPLLLMAAIIFVVFIPIGREPSQNQEVIITTAEAADKVAEEGRESAKRDYIRSIENYWESYYRLREVTLYDFEFKQKIYYTNPMLTSQ